MIKKIVFNIAIVFLVVFVLDFAIGRTLQHFYFKEKSGACFQITYSMETTKADILVFGASTARHHYVPEVFEGALKGTFYNTGQNALGIFFQLAMLESVLKRYTPRVIILDAEDSFEKEKSSYERLSCLLPYYREHKEIRKIVELRSPFERVKMISKIYPFNSHVLTVLGMNLNIIKGDELYNKGYVPLDGQWENKIYPTDTYAAYMVDPNKVIAFKEFIVRAKKSGASIFVVYPPILQELNIRQEIEIRREICLNEKVPFWDFSSNVLFYNNKGLFVDMVHLNHDGAMLFSKLIAAKIKDAINKRMP